jgi:hypothetical protein
MVIALFLRVEWFLFGPRILVRLLNAGEIRLPVLRCTRSWA